MLQIHGLDIALLVAYFLAMLAVGLYSARKVKNVVDYYMGGRRFGKALMIMYGFGAGTHADFAVGVASRSYKLGMAGIWLAVDADFQYAVLLVAQRRVPPRALPDHGGFRRCVTAPRSAFFTASWA